MYGLKYREQLPPVVADELDGLIAAIRNLFYVAHNEDGTPRELTRRVVPFDGEPMPQAPPPPPGVPVPDTRGY